MNVLKKIKQVISLFLKPANIVFRIVDIFFDKSDKKIKVRYQAIGKRILTVEPIYTLVHSLLHIQGFSNNDSRAILDAYKTEIYSSLCLEGIIFSENKFSIRVFDKNFNEHFLLSTDLIKNDMEILRCFNEIDLKTLIQLISQSLQMEESKQLDILLEEKNNHSNLIYLKNKT